MTLRWAVEVKWRNRRADSNDLARFYSKALDLSAHPWFIAKTGCTPSGQAYAQEKGILVSSEQEVQALADKAVTSPFPHSLSPLHLSPLHPCSPAPLLPRPIGQGRSGEEEQQGVGRQAIARRGAGDQQCSRCSGQASLTLPSLPHPTLSQRERGALTLPSPRGRGEPSPYPLPEGEGSPHPALSQRERGALTLTLSQRERGALTLPSPRGRG
ncbi:MAG: hypothetical protein QHJ81_16355 [Anaerolineae bacterium]|nr:hypothetical protein [Anaerolineae bacterium]